MTASVRSTDETVEVTWPDGTVTSLPYPWLRDNCGCSQCRVTQTTEKKFHLISVPADLKAETVRVEGDELHGSEVLGHSPYNVRLRIANPFE